MSADNMTIDVVKIMDEIRKGKFDEYDGETDVKVILENIKNIVYEKNLKCNILDLDEALKKSKGVAIVKQIEQVKPKCAVVYYRPIHNNVVIKIIKRVMRKLMAFCIIPMAGTQTEYNMTLVSIVENQNEQIHELQKEIMEMQEQIRKMTGINE